MPGWQNSDRRARLPGDWRHRRERVLRRDRHACQIRGPRCTGRAEEVDHVRRGDDHSLENLQAACAACHADKTRAERPASQRKRPPSPHPGLTPPAREDPPPCAT